MSLFKQYILEIANNFDCDIYFNSEIDCTLIIDRKYEICLGLEDINKLTIHNAYCKKTKRTSKTKLSKSNFKKIIQLIKEKCVEIMEVLEDGKGFESDEMKFFNCNEEIRTVKLITRGFKVIAKFQDGIEALYGEYTGTFESFYKTEKEFISYYTRTLKLKKLNENNFPKY